MRVAIAAPSRRRPRARSESIDSVRRLLYWPHSIRADYRARTCMQAKEPPHAAFPRPRRGRSHRSDRASPTRRPRSAPLPRETAADGRHRRRHLAVRLRRPTPWAGHSGAPDGSFHTIDGIPHFLSRDRRRPPAISPPTSTWCWASGWEEKADEYLPHLLGLPAGTAVPALRALAGRANAHWKLAAIDAYAGSRALAWIDDAFNDACHGWADARPAPTLLVQTVPERGLTSSEAQLLVEWARNGADTARPTRDRRRARQHNQAPVHTTLWTARSARPNGGGGLTSAGRIPRCRPHQATRPSIAGRAQGPTRPRLLL